MFLSQRAAKSLFSREATTMVVETKTAASRGWRRHFSTFLPLSSSSSSSASSNHAPTQRDFFHYYTESDPIPLKYVKIDRRPDSESASKTSYAKKDVPLIIMHGLFGNSLNFKSLATHNKFDLAESRTCYLLDLRNHGASPHTDAMNYPIMSQDLLKFINDHRIDTFDLIGFSMGGKVAMMSALDPQIAERIRCLVIGDIAPVKYSDADWVIPQTVDALLRLDLSKVHQRSDADAMLQQEIEDPNVRSFLLTNLVPNNNNGNSNSNGGSDGSEGGASPAPKFKWRMNLKAIHNQLREIADFPRSEQHQEVYHKPALFLRGGKSNLLEPRYHDATRQLFTNADIRCFEQAGHWVHNEQPDRFCKEVKQFFHEFDY